jgi:hypothetical protein
MERPNILNIPDFFTIGLMVIAFFLMLQVLGMGIYSFNSWRHPSSNASHSTVNGA